MRLWLPLRATQASAAEEVWHGKVGEHRPQASVRHGIQVVQVRQAGVPQETRRGEAPGVARVRYRPSAKSVPVGPVRGTAVQAKLAVCRHICKQLRHAEAGVWKRDSLSSPLLSGGCPESQKPRSPAGADSGHNPLSALFSFSPSIDLSLRHNNIRFKAEIESILPPLTLVCVCVCVCLSSWSHSFSLSSSFSCPPSFFSIHLSRTLLCRFSQSAETCSISCNRHLPLPTLSGGGGGI